MAANARVQRQAEHNGMGSLSPVQGLGALTSILSTPAAAAQQQPQFAAMSVDWSIVIKQVLWTDESPFVPCTSAGSRPDGCCSLPSNNEQLLSEAN